MDGEETLLEGEADGGSYQVTVVGLDGGEPTVRVDWTCFAPADDLVLALFDRLVGGRAPAAPWLAAGRAVAADPQAVATTTTNAPAVVKPVDAARC